jgi:hypothetical protein
MLHSRSAASPQLDLELDVDVPRESGQRWDTRSAITASRPVPGRPWGGRYGTNL